MVWTESDAGPPAKQTPDQPAGGENSLFMQKSPDVDGEKLTKNSFLDQFWTPFLSKITEKRKTIFVFLFVF